MAIPILATDQQFINEGIGHVLRQGLQTATITDAMVSSSTTNAGLRALVAAGTGATDVLPYKQLVDRALVLGFADGSMSDTNVNAATTVALLVANTISQAGKTGPIGEFI